MPNEKLDLIEYHTARAAQELEQANALASEMERRPHLELHSLHLSRAAALRAPD